jgi:Common central domain of tyrosinase
VRIHRLVSGPSALIIGAAALGFATPAHALGGALEITEENSSGQIIGTQTDVELASGVCDSAPIPQGATGVGSFTNAALNTVKVYNNSSCTGTPAATIQPLSANNPNDPLFYAHHAFIDLIWYEWQQRNPNLANTYSS